MSVKCIRLQNAKTDPSEDKRNHIQGELVRINQEKERIRDLIRKHERIAKEMQAIANIQALIILIEC